VQNGPTAASTDVDRLAFAAAQKGLQREHVSISKIRDMNIVADARAIRSRVVGSKHREGVTPSGGRIQHKRDDMRLGLVTFANFAGRVEITQCNPLQRASAQSPSMRSHIILVAPYGLTGLRGVFSWMGTTGGTP